MAHIRPFRAWRYNEEQLGNIEEMFSPLFDVVSAEQLEQLYANPYNSIHLSLPQSDAAVMEKLQDWKATGVILQDPLPGIYSYYQEFSLFGEHRKYVRKGFVAMVRIDAAAGTADSDIVLHEGTIAASVNCTTRQRANRAANNQTGRPVFPAAIGATVFTAPFAILLPVFSIAR